MEEIVQDLISYLESASIFLQQGFGDLALDEIELAKERANDLHIKTMKQFIKIKEHGYLFRNVYTKETTETILRIADIREVQRWDIEVRDGLTDEMDCIKVCMIYTNGKSYACDIEAFDEINAL